MVEIRLPRNLPIASPMNGLFQTSPRTENLTVLLTDIKGFTQRTAAQSREESAGWLARHELLLGPVVKVFGGVRRKDIGDAWLVTFGSPTDAVRCAMAIQDRLWAYDRLVPEEDRIEVRAVLTQGEVQIRGGELIGEAVTAALGLDGAADTGEVLLTESVYLAMNRKEAPTEEIGRRQVEGLPAPLGLYRAARVTHGDDGPPYGNRSLPPPPQLEIVDGDWLARQSRGAPADVPSRGISAELGAVGQKVMDAIGPMAEAAAKTGRRRLIVLGTAGALVVAIIALLALALVRAAPRDPVGTIARLVDSGRHEEAALAIRELIENEPERGADLHYLSGYLAWGQDRQVDASSSYRRAIREDAPRYADHRTIRDHMLQALEHESCPIRRGAAETLAQTGQREVLPALEAALEAEAQRPRGPLGLGRLRCDFAAAARRAISTLEEGGATR